MTTAPHPSQRNSRGLASGVPAAIGAATLFGASTPLAKGLSASVSAGLLAGLLYLGSGIGLSLGMLVLGRRSEASLEPKDLPWLGGAVAFGGVLGPLLLMCGLRLTPGSTASLLLNLEGVLTAVLAWTLFHENVDRRIALGMAFIVGGGAILAWPGQVTSAPVLGVLAVAGACLCWAIDNNVTQRVSAADPLQIAAIKGTVAGAVNVAIALAMGAKLPSAPTAATALATGLGGYGVSLALFVFALRGLGTARTSAYFSLAPFVGAAASTFFLHERVGPGFLVAALFMGAGAWLHLTERHEHDHAHEPIVHSHRHRHDEHHQHEHAPGVDPGEPHTHDHTHAPLRHRHPHYPDIHHRHTHG